VALCEPINFLLIAEIFGKVVILTILYSQNNISMTNDLTAGENKKQIRIQGISYPFHSCHKSILSLGFCPWMSGCPEQAFPGIASYVKGKSAFRPNLSFTEAIFLMGYSCRSADAEIRI